MFQKSVKRQKNVAELWAKNVSEKLLMDRAWICAQNFGALRYWKFWVPEGLEHQHKKKSEIAWFGKKVTFENCLEIGKIVSELKIGKIVSETIFGCPEGLLYVT